MDVWVASSGNVWVLRCVFNGNEWVLSGAFGGNGWVLGGPSLAMGVCVVFWWHWVDVGGPWWHQVNVQPIGGGFKCVWWVFWVHVRCISLDYSNLVLSSWVAVGDWVVQPWFRVSHGVFFLVIGNFSMEFLPNNKNWVLHLTCYKIHKLHATLIQCGVLFHYYQHSGKSNAKYCP